MDVNTLYNQLKDKNPHEPEFLQATNNFLRSIGPVLEQHPEWEKHGIIERLLEPDRVIQFRVSWIDDQNHVHVNRGYRVQYSNAIGPYKGGLRFHPSVNLSILKFLGFEQTFKNALTGLPLGGGKGGSDFNPKGKSDFEIMRFCQSFMQELYRHIGADTDVPAGDIGVGKREVGYLFGMYKRLANRWDGTMTGKGLSFGGSLLRPEATGYGLCYFMDNYLRDRGFHFADQTVIISGSGNVAIYACEKAQALGARVIAMSDSKGVIYDKNGIDLSMIKQLKERRESLENYLNHYDAEYLNDPKALWTIPCTMALPCATQNELDLSDAKILVQNGCRAVGEGANMPCTTEAVNYFQENNILYAPGKASNAGGVAVSGLEMSQNSERLSWTTQEVDEKLQTIMENIFRTVNDTASFYGKPGDLEFGANIAGLIKVGTALYEQGAL